MRKTLVVIPIGVLCGLGYYTATLPPCVFTPLDAAGILEGERSLAQLTRGEFRPVWDRMLSETKMDQRFEDYERTLQSTFEFLGPPISFEIYKTNLFCLPGGRSLLQLQTRLTGKFASRLAGLIVFKTNAGWVPGGIGLGEGE